MQEIISYFLVGILQGVIEWLPISSQGGIVIYLSNFLNIAPELSLNYSILLHIGTLFSAIIYFWKDIKEILSKNNLNLLFKHNFNLLYLKENESQHNLFLLRFILISVFVTFVISAPLYFLLKTNFSAINVLLINLIIGIFLIITGILIYFSQRTFFTNAKLSLKNSFLLGLFQGFSIIPGLSRSGLTTSLLLFRGFTPEKAFRYSFLLSIPTILIGEIALLIFNGLFFSPFILISIIVSFIIGYFTIDLLIRFAKSINFSYFCFILGFIYILTFFI